MVVYAPLVQRLRGLHTTSDLIPPDDILAECAMARETFVSSASEYLHALLIARVRLKPHESVLDLGSGSAHKAVPLTAYLNEHGRYEGHDIVAKWIAWCQRAYAPYPNFSFALADDLYSSHYNPNGPIKAKDYAFPYGDAQFDVVICLSLFTHLVPDETANYLRQVGRVLKPGGRLLMTAFLLTDETLPKLSSASIHFPHARETVGCAARTAQPTRSPSPRAASVRTSPRPACAYATSATATGRRCPNSTATFRTSSSLSSRPRPHRPVWIATPSSGRLTSDRTRATASLA